VFGDCPFPHDVEAGYSLPPNTLQQLRDLAEAGVEIGAHARNHLHLGGGLPGNTLVDEIVGAKHDLESVLHREIRYFAFPFGQRADLSTEAFQIAYSAGFQGVCSAYGDYNFPGDDWFHLRRIHADPELIRMKNWLTIDPRKLRGDKPFEAGEYRTEVELAVENPPLILSIR
jgi:peptidoglycan/xylan/chitin deacetylase (PgdA/CDA1 family)